MAASWAAAEAPPTPAPDPLAVRGYTVTGGAAPGYVEDRVCGSCHPDLFESYQEVAMARSFYRPRPENLIEDFESSYHHEPSRRHYRMARRGDGLVMMRHQLDAEGQPIHKVEIEVDWILGSGNQSRTYLYRTPGGELYQLPLAWYSRTRSWGMAPGFDRADHLGLLRRVRRECMFCHNAYPDAPAGSDVHNAPDVYPEELPEGLGCQRCHGPGAEHSRIAMRESVDFERLYATIVNPGDLEPELRDDVCYGCHMQPSVAIPGIRRLGRADYSFRPGESLADYLVATDVVEAGKDKTERFEINHHPYRLEQSRCFEASEGAMSCLTCHDPHRKVPEAERVAHYRAACLGCHQVEACRLEEMASEVAVPAVAADDCAGCHMQKRRTQDVVRVLMTDHRIRRRPGGPELLATLAEAADPILDDVVFLRPEQVPEGALGKLYRAYTVSEFSSGAYAPAVEALERLLAEVRPPELEPYFALAKGQMKHRRLGAAERTLEEILKRSPDYPTALERLGILQERFGQREQAVATILEALEGGPERAATRYNLGALLNKLGRFAEAVPHLERAVELTPNMNGGWYQLGEAQARLGAVDDAVASYRRALELDPTHSRAYLALGRLLIRQDRRAEALRYWRHGAEHAKQPERIVKALAEAEREPAASR